MEGPSPDAVHPEPKLHRKRPVRRVVETALTIAILLLLGQSAWMISRMVGRGQPPKPATAPGPGAGGWPTGGARDPCVPLVDPQRSTDPGSLIRSPGEPVMTELAEGASVPWPVPSSWSRRGAWRMGGGRLTARYQADVEPRAAAGALSSTWEQAGYEVVSTRRGGAGRLVLAVGEASALTAYLRRPGGTRTMAKVTVVYEPRAPEAIGAPRGSR